MVERPQRSVNLVLVMFDRYLVETEQFVETLAKLKADRALPELETFLEGEVANGETSETRLTYDGLCYLRQILRQP